MKTYFIFLFTITFLLVGCSGEADEAKKLGFSNAEEMTKIQSQGWHTKAQFDADNHVKVHQVKTDKSNEERIKKLEEFGYCYGMAQHAMSLGIKLEVLMQPQLIKLIQEKYLPIADVAATKSNQCVQKNMTIEQCISTNMNDEESAYFKKYVIGNQSPKDRKLDVENVKSETIMVCALLK
jgi:hypothetical protein